MGHYQFNELAVGQPFPLFTAELSSSALRSLAGNATWLNPRYSAWFQGLVLLAEGMHLSVVGALWSVVLTSLRFHT